MARLADLLEDYRNLVGRANWSIGRDIDAMSGYDPDLAEFVERSSLGTGAHGLGAGGLAGMIKASHGSPHAFTKFDFSKIGTGEGAQAYGHGGYFAQGFDSPTAKQYQENVKDMASIQAINDRMKELSRVMSSDEIAGQYRKYKSDVGRNAADEYDALMEQRNVIRTDPGHLYNVELRWPDAAREAADPLGEHHLLDWDAPLSEQHPSVLSAIKNAGVNVLPQPKSSMIKDPGIRQIVRYALKQDIPENVGLMVDNDYQLYQQAMNLAKKLGVDIDESSIGDFVTEQASDYLKALSNYRGQTGESVYRSLMENPTSMVEATQKLNKVGIPGIRYLDQGSRGAGQGSRNYVMFDDALANIVSRNGVSLSDLLRR